MSMLLAINEMLLSTNVLTDEATMLSVKNAIAIFGEPLTSNAMGDLGFDVETKNFLAKEDWEGD